MTWTDVLKYGPGWAACVLIVLAVLIEWSK